MALPVSRCPSISSGISLSPTVVAARRADEDSGPGAAQRCGIDARAFEGLPGCLQQQPLLGIRRQRLARGDPEEIRVELSGVIKESASAPVPGVAGSQSRSIGSPPTASLPPSTNSHRHQARSPAREATGHAHDHHRLSHPGTVTVTRTQTGQSGRLNPVRTLRRDGRRKVPGKRGRGGMVETRVAGSRNPVT